MPDGDFRPRMVGRLFTVVTDGALLVHSDSRRLVFRVGESGSAAFLQDVIPLLDGERDPAAVCAETGLEPSDLERMLGVLDAAGLVEWDRGGQQPRSPLPDVQRYMSGSLAWRSAHKTSHEIVEMLSASAVILDGSPGIIGAVRADLAAIGLGRVLTALPADDLVSAAAAAQRSFPNCLVLLRDSPHDRRRFDEALSALVVRSCPVLRYQACGGGLEIGPVFRAGYPCCLECFRQCQPDCCPACSGVLDLPPEDSFWQDGDFPAGLLADRVVSHLVGDGTVNCWPRTMWKLTAERVISSTRFAVVPDAGCPACGWGAGGEGRGSEVPQFTQAALNSECLVEPWPGSRDSRPRHTRVPEDPDSRYRGYLPEAVLDSTGLAPALEEPPGTRRYGQQMVAALLGAVGDALEQPVGHGTLTPYLLVPWGLFEIPGSVFRYEAPARRIVAVSTERQALSRYREATGREPGPVVMLFVGNAPSGARETSQAWRLAQLATGYAVGALAATARPAGLGLCPGAAADEPALARMLELWPEREFITAAVEISLEAGERQCP